MLVVAATTGGLRSGEPSTESRLACRASVGNDQSGATRQLAGPRGRPARSPPTGRATLNDGQRRSRSPNVATTRSSSSSRSPFPLSDTGDVRADRLGDVPRRSRGRVGQDYCAARQRDIPPPTVPSTNGPHRRLTRGGHRRPTPTTRASSPSRRCSGTAVARLALHGPTRRVVARIPRSQPSQWRYASIHSAPAGAGVGKGRSRIGMDWRA